MAFTSRLKIANIFVAVTNNLSTHGVISYVHQGIVDDFQLSNLFYVKFCQCILLPEEGIVYFGKKLKNVVHVCVTYVLKTSVVWLVIVNRSDEQFLTESWSLSEILGTSGWRSRSSWPSSWITIIFVIVILQIILWWWFLHFGFKFCHSLVH